MCDGDYTLRYYPYQLYCKDKDNFGNHQIFCVKKSQQYISWYKKIGEELKSPPPVCYIYRFTFIVSYVH